MSSYQPPRQARARATVERIFEATVRLLADRPFEAISVADIVSEAHTSVGAFYKRFSSKDALLPVLRESLQQLAGRFGSEFATSCRSSQEQ